MKTILKIIFIFCMQIGFAQEYYSHYLDSTSEWRELEKNGTAGDLWYDFKTRFFEGFEDIEGYTYYKMYVTQFTKRYVGNDDFEPYYVSDEETFFLGYFREDATGKFYFLYPNYTEADVFDNQSVLDATIGVSFSDFDINFYGQNNAESCTINSFSSISLNDLELKVLNRDLFGNFNGLVAEGIGYIQHYCDNMYNLYLTFNTDLAFISCYTKQGESISFFQDYSIFDTVIDCNTFPNANRAGLNVDQFSQTKLQCYPNPTNSFVNFESDNETITNFQIYDMQGRVLVDKIVNDKKFQVDISDYQNGTYFVKVFTGKESKTRKIVKI